MFPCIISFPGAATSAIVARMSAIAVEAAGIQAYGDAYRQTVQVKPTDEAIAYLREVRERYMGYKNLLN